MTMTPLQIVDRLIAAVPDLDTRTLALQIKIRLKFPMADILEDVPGTKDPKNEKSKDDDDVVAAKCRTLHVSRTAYYGWLNGKTRPRKAEALIIAKATRNKYKLHEITGHPT